MLADDDTSLNRNGAAAASTLDTRWLVGIVIVTPILLVASVFWLHQLPDGPRSRGASPVVEVRLVQPPMQVPATEQATQPPEPIEHRGRREPLVAAPERPIPEEAERTSRAVAIARPAPGLEEAPTASTARPRSVPSGVASAFQKTLLTHIARYRPAQRDRLQGVAQVLFVMRRDGTVTEVWVRTSSGHVALDQAAADTVRRAQPLPAIPPELPERLTILLPVSFDVP